MTRLAACKTAIGTKAFAKVIRHEVIRLHGLPGDAHAQAPQRLHLSTDTTDPLLGSPWGPQPSRNQEFDSLLRLRAYQHGSSNDDDPDSLCDGMLVTVAVTST